MPPKGILDFVSINDLSCGRDSVFLEETPDGFLFMDGQRQFIVHHDQSITEL